MAIDLVNGGLLGDGRYRLERMLGSGGMATVWLAKDEVLRRNVAVKILSDVLALDAAYVRRFEREAQLAASLSHPHLVNVFDFSSPEASRPYLVMEYVEGVTVADEIDRGAKPDARGLAQVLLEALTYIHAAGIIHRDLKPANILVGADGRVRLTDFGIAQAPNSTRLTATGNVVGTAKYMPPEILHGDSATERSDLYSCGVVLGECLNDRAPEGMRLLVERLTAASPGDRPGSAAEALRLLDERGTTATESQGFSPREGSPAVEGLPATERLPAGERPPASERLPRAGETAATREVTRPKDGRQNDRDALTKTITIGPRALWALAAVVAVVILIVALSGGGGSGRSGQGGTGAAPASAPLGSQIDALRREVRRSAGH